MEDLEELLLGAPLSLTRREVVERAGVPLAQAQSVWSAMGFPAVADDVQAFTDADVTALRTAMSLLDLGVIDPDTLLIMARTMGQGLARLAEAQVGVLRGLSAGMTVEQAMAIVSGSAQDVVPKLEDLVLFVWRRQFAAAVQRSIVAAREDGMPILAIGFVDLVDFTRSTRTWDTAQLSRTLETFERGTSLRVVAAGGRVVKTLGDGVLFVCDDALGAVAVALDTVEAHERDPDLPSVRAGVAMGPVLVRLGDVFGQPVNIASRLSDEARPGSVLVDGPVAEAAQGRFAVRTLSKRSVRGYRTLTPYLLRRLES